VALICSSRTNNSVAKRLSMLGKLAAFIGVSVGCAGLVCGATARVSIFMMFLIKLLKRIETWSRIVIVIGAAANLYSQTLWPTFCLDLLKTPNVGHNGRLFKFF
jgi:hypothetical protein